MTDLFTSTQGHSNCSIRNINPSSSCFNVTSHFNFNNSNIFGFSVIHQNIRSMRENFDKLIVSLNSFDKIPDIIFLSETWIYDPELKFYNIPNFISIGCCNNNYRAGGVCAFYDSSLNCTYESISLCSADIIKMSVLIDKVKYVFVCVYRLQFIPVSTFVSDFTDFLAEIINQNVIILGDMNIDILNVPQIYDSYIFMMSSFGFHSMVNSPTRITSSTSTCIDHCFARFGNVNDLNASLYNLHISDHHLIKIDITVRSNLPKNKKLIFNKFNSKKFIADISSYNFSNMFILSDPTLIITDISAIFKQITETCICKVIKCNSQVKLKPWITNSLLNLMNKKKKIERKCRNHPENVKLRNYFVKLCRMVEETVSSDKHKYYDNKFSSCGRDSKKTWSLVNDILGNGSCQTIDKILSKDSILLSDSEEIANEFANYFSRIVYDLRLSYDFSTLHSCLYYSNEVMDSFFINPVTDTEIINIINHLKNSSSLDVLGFNSNMIKYTVDIIAPILVHFINQCFIVGIVPDVLKTAITIPLLKKGRNDIMDNYRPIAIQPTILKIMEKAMKARIELFLNKHNMLSNHQHGFTKGKSTESALIEFLDEVHSNLNQKRCVAAVFIDIKRAFDMVDHKLLLVKLQSIGFRGIALNWFESYLNNRSFIVKIGNSYSDPVGVEYGVPQGSVLGPLLFLIYIDSLFSIKLKGKLTAFADDVALTYCGSSSSTVANIINSDMKVLRCWFDAHSLLLSEKTKVMYFKILGDPYHSYIPEIFYHIQNCDLINCSSFCIQIEPVTSFKYLGFNLDCNLNWKIHCHKIKEQLNSALRAIYLLRKFCPSHVLLNFYYSCVESRLGYGLPCWGGVYFNTIEPLYILQKHILRVIFFKHRGDHTWPIFVECNILPLQHLFIFRVLKLFYSRSGHRLLRLIAAYDIRGNYLTLFTIPRYTTEIFRKYYLVSAPTFFNRLPIYIRLIFNSKMFMKSLKGWLMENRDVGFMFTK